MCYGEKCNECQNTRNTDTRMQRSNRSSSGVLYCRGFHGFTDSVSYIEIILISAVRRSRPECLEKRYRMGQLLLGVHANSSIGAQFGRLFYSRMRMSDRKFVQIPHKTRQMRCSASEPRSTAYRAGIHLEQIKLSKNSMLLFFVVLCQSI